MSICQTFEIKVVSVGRSVVLIVANLRIKKHRKLAQTPSHSDQRRIFAVVNIVSIPTRYGKAVVGVEDGVKV